MTELAMKTGRAALEWAGIKWPSNGWRLLVIALLAALILSGRDSRADLETAPQAPQLVFENLAALAEALA